MNKTFRWVVLAMGMYALLATVVNAEPIVQNVTASQRWPWSGKVDICYEVVGHESPDEMRGVVSITASDHMGGMKYLSNVSALSGDVELEEGMHHVVWDLEKQGIEFQSSSVGFMVSYDEYCVIDLSVGTNTTTYPIVKWRGIPAPAGFNTAEYKKAKIVMRRIFPGSFHMLDGPSVVTLTSSFWIGVFEVTRMQWDLVMQGNSLQSNNAMLPKVEVSYDMIRGSGSGTNWPVNNAVDTDSFIGRLREKTGMNFDLPTEAQWVSACRAGTTGLYNNGGNTTNDLNQLGRYQGTRPGGSAVDPTVVGSYLPNAWGIYDMHGNVWEWCLDWYDSLSDDDETNPVGVASGLSRVVRGGSWWNEAHECSVFSRRGLNPSKKYSTDTAYGYCIENYTGYGFRLACPLVGERGKESLRIDSGDK